jgi:hypothetical protein
MRNRRRELTLRDIAWLGVAIDEIILNQNDHCTVFMKKIGRKKRRLVNSSDLYKTVQAGILSLLEQSPLLVHESAYGWVRNRSREDCLAPHVRQRVVMEIDLKNYFFQIDDSKIARYFAKYNITELAGIPAESIILATTFDVFKNGQRVLPQGFKTSGFIANAVRYDLDEAIAQWCFERGLIYTNYGDNLIVSGDTIRKRVEGEEVASIIASHGFRSGKIKVMPFYTRQEVLGYVINEKINVSKDYRERVNKKIIKYLRGEENLSPHQVRGYINAVKVNPRAKQYLKKLVEGGTNA